MSALIPVRLVKRHTLYNEGEVAGFPPDVAAQLIARGHAEAYDPTGAQVNPVVDVTTDPPPSNAEGEGEAGEGAGEGEGEGEGEKLPNGESTTPPADKSPKPKAKK